MSNPSTHPPPPPFKFTSHPSTSQFTVPYETYLSHLPPSPSTPVFIATGSLVFSPASSSKPERILLIQRSSSDSFPNLWEIPGGACDPEDASILHSAARELWEEAGLVARRIGREVGVGYEWVFGGGQVARKFSFLVEVEDQGQGGEGELEVRLREDEHQDFVWASEEEVKRGRVGELELEFTWKAQEETILKGFEMRREEREEREGGRL